MHYRARLSHAEFWFPYLSEILERYDLEDLVGARMEAAGWTYPTFVLDDRVVKMFGYMPTWRESHAAEREALTVLATDAEIGAPRLLAEGQLFETGDMPWPYLITTRMKGVPCNYAWRYGKEKLSLAAQLGRQVRRVHALRPSGVGRDEDWPALDVAAAGALSSLPAHLVAQSEDYVARWGAFDRSSSERVLVHSGLTDHHVFVQDGSLTGIIDWSSAMVSDRLSELGSLHLVMFGGNKALLRAFLDASESPARRARHLLVRGACRRRLTQQPI